MVHVTGGVQPGSARGRTEYVDGGFVEIHFAFPGDGDSRSGGTYDFRGPNCIRATADVIRFAAGRLADKRGKLIGELVAGMKVLTGNCGIVGSSHGGNACGLTMANFGQEFPELAWYSPCILAEAERRKLIAGQRPRHIPSLDESKAFWHWRDATPSIPEAVRKLPNLAVIAYANERDHVQAAPDHGHILEQIEGFRRANARFVRLNPDRAYVERVLSDIRAAAGPGPTFLRAPACFADNPASQAYDRSNIAGALEPAAVPLGLYMQAAVQELADRARSGNWAPNLDAVIPRDAPAAPGVRTTATEPRAP